MKSPHLTQTKEAPYGSCNVCGIPKPVKLTNMGIKESTASTLKRKTCLGKPSECYSILIAKGNEKRERIKGKPVIRVDAQNLFLYGMITDTSHL